MHLPDGCRNCPQHLALAHVHVGRVAILDTFIHKFNDHQAQDLIPHTYHLLPVILVGE